MRALGLFAVGVLGAAGVIGAGLGPPASAAATGVLALEPIGGFTDLGDVRVVTTALCPEESTNVVIRISGGGFAPESNVIANSRLDGQLRTPDGTGYVIPIFSDWEYLAVSHQARTPLSGPAELTMLCADQDLERIEARMSGRLTFSSRAGEKSTYLQDGGPRLATGIPGIPPPGNGGVPDDAPTAPPVPVDGRTESRSGSSDVAASEPRREGPSTGSVRADTRNDADNTGAIDGRPAGNSATSSPKLLGALALLAILLAWAGFTLIRRPRDRDHAFSEEAS